MAGRAEIIVQLKGDIIDGKMNLQQTKNRINELETQYGQDFFFDSANVEEKPKPWNKEYLHELEIKSMTGMSSKQFILHLAEVSEEVYSQKNKKKTSSVKEEKSNSKIDTKISSWVWVVVVILAIGAILGLISIFES